MAFDMKRQRAVWQRVYPKPSGPQPRQQLAMARRRASESLRFYEGRQNDPIYGPAYQQLSSLCSQELAMLDRIR